MMDWRDIAAAAIATLVAGAVEEAIRRSIRGKAGTIAGGAAATALWPKVRDEVRRWLDGWGASPA